jgi:hypothetical protein
MVVLVCRGRGGLRRGAYGTVLLWCMVGARMVYTGIIGEGMQEGHALITGCVPGACGINRIRLPTVVLEHTYSTVNYTCM